MQHSNLAVPNYLPMMTPGGGPRPGGGMMGKGGDLCGRPAMLPRLARVSDIRSTDAATFATFLMHDERPEKGLVDRRPAAKGSTASCCWVSETPAAAERPDLLELLSRLLSATVERRSLLVAQDVLRPDIAA